MGNPNRRGERVQRRQHDRDSDDPTTRTTFYVTNITDRVTGLKLREAFRDFVNVTDAWVPRKRMIKGRVFGFVRCEKIRNPYPILETLNEISIMESRISVSLAMFDRAHKKISYDEEGPAKKVWVPREKNIVDADFPSIGTVYGGTSGSKKLLEINEGGATYPTHCVGRAVVGVSDTIDRFRNVKKMLVAAGHPDAAVSYLGGLSVLIAFHDNAEMSLFKDTKEEVWKEALVSVVPWTGQALPFERIALLKVVGLPVMIRDDGVFDRIGSLFGNVVWPSDFSWIALDNSVGFTHVLTKCASRIDEEVTILWKGKNHSVWVVEESSSWVPEMVEVEVDEKDDEMEEGEFRADTPEMVDGDSAGEVPLQSNAEVTPDDTGVLNALNNLPYVENHAVGAEFLNQLGQVGPLGEQNSFSNVGKTQLSTPVGPLCDESLEFNVGRPSIFKSRKRTRMVFFNSPEDNMRNAVVRDPPAQENFTLMPDLNNTSIDMEVPVDVQIPQQSGESVEGEGPVEQVLDPGCIDAGVHPDSVTDVVNEAVGINKEVDATVQVGNLVGINLNNCEGLVAGEIVSEIGSVVV